MQRVKIIHHITEQRTEVSKDFSMRIGVAGEFNSGEGTLPLVINLKMSATAMCEQPQPEHRITVVSVH